MANNNTAVYAYTKKLFWLGIFYWHQQYLFCSFNLPLFSFISEASDGTWAIWLNWRNEKKKVKTELPSKKIMWEEAVEGYMRKKMITTSLIIVIVVKREKR